MIRIEGLEFSYQDEPQRKILQDININFNQNELTMILGPNGCGKTTLIKLIARLLNPDKGKLLLKNKPYNYYNLREFYKKISYVPQKFNSIFPYTVFETVMMGRTLNFGFLHFEREEDVNKVMDVMEKLEILHLANKSINEISGGELQRVILAKALVQEAEILLLDEPNTHLDPKHQIFIFDLLKKLINEGKTVIAVSHDLSLAGFYSDRIIFLKDGKVYSDGNRKDVLNKETIKETFEIESEIVFNDSQLPHLIIKPNNISE